jgi:hypothetical protein
MCRGWRGSGRDRQGARKRCQHRRAPGRTAAHPTCKPGCSRNSARGVCSARVSEIVLDGRQKRNWQGWRPLRLWRTSGAMMRSGCLPSLTLLSGPSWFTKPLTGTRSISMVEAVRDGGGTRIAPALGEACRRILAVDATSKHNRFGPHIRV